VTATSSFDFCVDISQKTVDKSSYRNKSKKNMHRPWITQSLIRRCRKKSRLLKNLTKFPNIINKIKYKRYIERL